MALNDETRAFGVYYMPDYTYTTEAHKEYCYQVSGFFGSSLSVPPTQPNPESPH